MALDADSSRDLPLNPRSGLAASKPLLEPSGRHTQALEQRIDTNAAPAKVGDRQD